MKTLSTIREGTILRHPKFGRCELISRDDKTYSIAMLTVGINTKQVDGGTIQDVICRPECEFIDF